MTDLATMLVEDKAIEIVKNALKKGATMEFVSDITGLDESTIERLQTELDQELSPVAKRLR